MSSIHKFKSDEHNVENENRLNGFYNDKRVNVTDLVSKMKSEHKKERKNNYILTAAAISAVQVVG